MTGAVGSGVTPPRYIEPNAVYAIMRRVEGRRFLLRPDGALNDLVRYYLALFAQRHGVKIHVMVVMSTHFHMVASVPDENVSEFMHDLDLLLSIDVKRLRTRAIGVTWEPGGLSIIQLHGEKAVEKAIAYAIANPVASGLVWRPEDWPGVTASVEELGEKELAGSRPPRRSPAYWPARASIRLTWPECLADDVEGARERIGTRVEVLVEAARAEAKRKGWRIMSRVEACSVSPYRVARTEEEPGGLRPQVMASSREERIAALRRLKTFRARHAECKERWCAGDRCVVFPAGTYWMKKHHAAACEPFP